MKREIHKNKSELHITVPLEKQLWKKAQDDSFKKLSKGLSVKGFRKGQVPLEVAKKTIKQDDIWTEAIKIVTPALNKTANEALKETDEILMGPSYSVDKITDAELELKFIYPVYPEFKIPDYKNLKIAFKPEAVTKEEIQSEIDKIQQQNSLMKPKDGAIILTDLVRFDFEGFIEGKAFEGGSAKDFQLEIGSGQFIPGFEDQMVGLKAGDQKDIKVTFPDDYPQAEMKSKEAVFKINIKEVSVKETPIMDDGLAASLGIDDVQTVAQLDSFLRENMGERKLEMEKNKFYQEAMKVLSKDLEVPIPSAILAGDIQQLEKSFANQLKQQNITLENYIKMTKMSIDDLRKNFFKQSQERLTHALIMTKIAKAEKIELTDADYDAEYLKLSRIYKQPVEVVKQQISKQQAQVPMTNTRVVDALIAYSAGSKTAAKPAAKKPAEKKTTTKK